MPLTASQRVFRERMLARIHDKIRAKNQAPSEVIKITDGNAQPAAIAKPAAAPRPIEGNTMNAFTPLDMIRDADRTMDNPAFRNFAFSDSLAATCSALYAPKAHEASRPFIGCGIVALAAEVIHRAGHKVINPADKAGIIQAAMHTSSAFPLLLADSANKIALAHYEAAKPSYKMFTGEKTFNDFRPHKVLRVGDFPNLLQVGEGGEVTRGTISESKEEVTLGTYARMLSLGRALLINDDTGSFGEMSKGIGTRVASWENDFVFAILLLNGVGPVLATTGLTLFHATHTNFQDTGTALNVISNLSAARAAMQKQTGLDGLKLNLKAKVLLTGPDGFTAAEQITGKLSPVRITGVNPHADTLTPISDSNITDYAWFLFADPNVAPVIVAGSLPGQTGPLIAAQQGWNSMGMEIRVVRDFGAGAVDYRGVYRDDGSAPEDEPVAT